MTLRLRFPVLSLALTGATVLAAGCHAPAALPTPSHEAAIAQQHAEVESQREQLAMIPPPSKNRFMAIHNLDSWENPYIIVQPGIFQMHVTLEDANPSPVGAGGMLRPVGARRQELNISPDKLAEAVTSIPQNAWPYGRVIALEEAHKTPANMEPAVRRAMETAVSKLNDLGVEVYDPTEGNLR